MKVPRPIRRLYYAHETLAKVSGMVIFLIVVILLYVAVFRTPQVTSVAGIPTATPTATATSTAAAQTPLPVATASPPFAMGHYKVKTKQDVAYGAVTNLSERLDLCSPTGATGLRPGLLILHGGSFVDGDKADADPYCADFASYGFVVAIANYRLAPQNLWPAPLVDAQLALRWMRANASQNQMDPARVCAMGDAAGASLAVSLGVLTTIHAGDKSGLYSNESPQASCVVDEFGPVDLTKLLGVPTWNAASAQLFGADNQYNTLLLRDASPIFAISRQSAPMLIVQGIDDTTVPPSQAEELQTQLQSFGVPFSTINYQGGYEFATLSARQVAAIDSQVLAFLENHEHP